MAQENFSSVYWLGGFHTGGKIRGANWLRGRWTGGTWDKGNFYSVDLAIDWEGANRNLWSKWSGGIWRSNSQNYGFNSWALENEWSVWHGGTWESQRHTSQNYTWQGPFTNSVNIYGDLTTYECDIPSGNTLAKRSIYLPSPKSLWLGGQWLRGDFKGGIFACGAWHSLKWDPANYSYLDSLFFMYGGQGGVPPWSTEVVTISGNNYIFIVDDNEGVPFETYLYNDAEFFDIDLTLQYDENLSNFYQGGFVNSIWEGGTVINASSDPMNSLFGMSIDSETSKIQDDSGFFSQTGFLESNQLLRRRRHGLNMIDYSQYYENSLANNLNQVLFINGNQYYMPNKFDSGGIYSVVWKRGKFQNGAFMYGQWYDYDVNNTLRTNYVTDLNIQNNYNDYTNNLPNNYSVFENGVFYSGLWFNGIFLAKNNTNAFDKKSVFSRSHWFNGYWAAAENNATTFSNDRKLSNATFWKSVWYNGIWEGGEMSMSVWNSINPFNYALMLDGNTIAPTGVNFNVWSNLEENPMGLINNIAYYDVNNNNTALYNGFINDMSKLDLIKKQPVEGFDFVNLISDSVDFYIEYEGTSGAFDPGPYDFELDDDASTSGIAYQYLFNSDEFFVNEPTVNAAYLRYAGLVDNYASRWKNGTARGVIWNGGLWMTGEFKSYLFEDYPTYITDRRNDSLTVQLDWFDDDVISLASLQKIQNGVWMRGLWLAGYFRASSYMLGVSAFIRNALQGLTLNFANKFLISDDLLSGQFNSLNAEITSLKPNNYTSIFARKTLRDTDVPYFSMFNGQMLSGIMYDINKNGTDTPNFGSLAFADDIINNPNGVTFGKVTYDITVNPDAAGNPINPDNNNISFRVKNSSLSLGIDLNIAQPFAYDDINITFSYNLTNQQYINMFYYNSIQTIVQATGPDSNYNIRHAAQTGNMPKWTDILPITEAATRVPSTAQGSGAQEPYYEILPVIWVDSGYGQ